MDLMGGKFGGMTVTGTHWRYGQHCCWHGLKGPALYIVHASQQSSTRCHKACMLSLHPFLPYRTPKQLTAAAIRVSVGEMLVDQQALLFQQRVALKNIPIGSCTLTLTPADLGNFMTHDLMKAPAGKVCFVPVTIG